MFVPEISVVYRVDGVYVDQETEKNEASAKYVDWASCAWLLLSFFPFPVRHPLHPLCTRFAEQHPKLPFFPAATPSVLFETQHPSILFPFILLSSQKGKLHSDSAE